VLDDRTGRFIYANGGHNPPILVDSEGANPLPTTGGVALGMFDGLDYADASVDMEPGARLVLFSDGVTEAFNDNDEAFGDDRLLDATRALPGEQGPNQDVTDIVTAVDEFAGEAPQFDDITCVVLVYKGGNSQDPGAPKAPGEAI
jgi:sigma-B regulation protein RsbU (phosphoserine phosphatase)